MYEYIPLCDDNGFMEQIWSTDGHYFTFAVQILENPWDYVLYGVVTVAILHTTIVFHATI